VVLWTQAVIVVGAVVCATATPPRTPRLRKSPSRPVKRLLRLRSIEMVFISTLLLFDF
jgi:hypothetical protein